MQKNIKNKPTLSDKDVFSEAFYDFQKTKLATRLQEKFRLKAYYERYKNMYVSTYILGFLLNFLSAFTASSLVFFFGKEFIFSRIGSTGSVVLSFIISIAFALLIENKKRNVLSNFFKDLYQFGKFRIGLAVVGILIVAGSIVFSFFGGQWFIIEVTPDAVLVQKDSVINSLNDQIASTNTQIKKHQSNIVTDRNGQRVVSWQSQKAITTLEEKNLLLTERLLSVERSIEDQNGVIEIQHKSRVELSAWNFAFACLAFEIFFIFCTSYTEYYDYRSQCEMRKISMIIDSENEQGVANMSQLSQDVAIVQDVPGQVSLSQDVANLSQTDPVLNRQFLATNGGNQLLDAMLSQIDEIQDESKKLELKSFRRAAQRARSRLVTETGRPETSLKNILRAVEDFEKTSGKKLFS